MSAMHGEHVVLTAFTSDAATGPLVVEFSDDALPVDDPGDSDGGVSLYVITILSFSDYGINASRYLMQIDRGTNTGTVNSLNIENITHVSGSTFSFEVHSQNPESWMIILTREMCQWPLHT